MGVTLHRAQQKFQSLMYDSAPETIASLLAAKTQNARTQHRPYLRKPHLAYQPFP